MGSIPENGGDEESDIGPAEEELEGLDDLHDREARRIEQVWQLFVQGIPVHEIGQKLGLSSQTVEDDVTKMRERRRDPLRHADSFQLLADATGHMDAITAKAYAELASARRVADRERMMNVIVSTQAERAKLLMAAGEIKRRYAGDSLSDPTVRINKLTTEEAKKEAIGWCRKFILLDPASFRDLLRDDVVERIQKEGGFERD